MAGHAVVIAGGGPTGLMLAAELHLADVDVAVVERRVDQEVDGSRAGGLHSRTIEVLDQRGIAARFLDAGRVMQVNAYAGVPLDISDFPSRHPYGLALWQREFERILAEWVEGELGVRIERGVEVTSVHQDDDGVDVGLSDGRTLRAAYLVGCDGGRSTVRKEAGIDFPGVDASTSWMIAEVEMDGDPELGFRRDHLGQHAIGRRQPDEPIRLVLTEAEVDHDHPPTFDELRSALVGVYGTDFGLRSAAWISRFTDAVRQAASYREGRILLAGDAAHVHPPQGGQGLGTGVQDAVNLGWKLAQVVQGRSPVELLDTYHAERHPVAERVLHHTMVQVAVSKPDARHDALRTTMGELLAMDEARVRFGAIMSGLDIRYEPEAGSESHPLVGRRMPDLDLTTADGATRVFELLRTARPLLLAFDGDASIDLDEWDGHIRLVRASTDGPWSLPVIGQVAPPPAALVRPDGHVAWVGELHDPSLVDALVRWFGPPT